MAPLLECRDLVVRYKSFEAVRGISLHAYRGEILGLRTGPPPSPARSTRSHRATPPASRGRCNRSRPADSRSTPLVLRPAGSELTASNVAIIDVEDRRSLDPDGILPVAMGVPIVVGGLLIGQIGYRRRSWRDD